MQRSFRYAIKQHGGMLAKGRLLGIQFAELMRGGNDCLYFRLARHADALAMRVRNAFELRGVPLWVPSVTNMQFPALTRAQQQKLAEKYLFEVWGKFDDERDVVRFCTSWATRDEAVDALCNDIMSL